MNKKDMLDMFVEDSKAQEISLPDKKKLNEVSKMIKEMMAYQATIEDLEEKMKKTHDKYKELNEKKIPDYFDELGLSTLSLTDGTKVEIKRTYAGSITKANKDAAHKWLINNGHGALIKHVIATELKKDDTKHATKLTDFLKKIGLSFKDKEAVHAGTLKAFINEQMEKGGKFPEKLFSVFPLRFTKLSS